MIILEESFLNKTTGKTFAGDIPGFVDEVIISLGADKDKSFPFYYEDMVGYGPNVSTRTYTVLDSSETEYAIDSLHDISTVSNRAVYVYLNDVQLVLGTDYTFSTTDESINITATLSANDVIKIRDYR